MSIDVEVWSKQKEAWELLRRCDNQAQADTMIRNWQRDGYKVRVKPAEPSQDQKAAALKYLTDTSNPKYTRGPYVLFATDDGGRSLLDLEDPTAQHVGVRVCQTWEEVQTAQADAERATGGDVDYLVVPAAWVLNAGALLGVAGRIAGRWALEDKGAVFPAAGEKSALEAAIAAMRPA